ncbi:MAG: hypothetical protein IJC78_06250 [Clostridia bacterium]|nr:hypothetical protein [Clostridia bacterium]
MCGLCRLFSCGRRNNCGCREAEYSCRREEPRTNRYCASGIGTASETPCGCGYTREYDCDCGCERHRDCDCDCD